ncbi:hypothetical protein AALB16_12810 [Lachnospiraceae bacterium 62-35]
MSMQVRPNYVNPLTMMSGRETKWKLGQSTTKQEGKINKVKELQTKQQQLQSQILLMKTVGTDSAGATAKSRKMLEEKLENISVELRAAKADNAKYGGQGKSSQPAIESASMRPDKDVYESGVNPPSPGIYRMEKDGEEKYTAAFTPYSED